VSTGMLVVGKVQSRVKGDPYGGILKNTKINNKSPRQKFNLLRVCSKYCKVFDVCFVGPFLVQKSELSLFLTFSL
jgi:hypothetical protein